MKQVPITMLSLLSPMALLVWSSASMAVPPGPCPGPVFIEAFDGAPAIVCPRPKARFDYFASYATSFGALTAAAGQPITWNIASNGSPAAPISVQFGSSSSNGVAEADFDGDGKFDVAVYDVSIGGFSYLPSSGGAAVSVPWRSGDPANDFYTALGDYDCDGKTDPTYVRDVSGSLQWSINTSGPGPDRTVNFGTTASDVFLPGMDWNGDGCDDLGTVRIEGSGALTYRIGDTTSGALLLQNSPVVSAGVPFSFNTDFIVPGDYLGDERADFAVWRSFGTGTNGFWYVRENGGSGSLSMAFGTPGAGTVRDIALRGDYDGDGKDDIAVKVINTATWKWRRSSDGVIDQTTVGAPGDFPIPQYGVQ